jgi:hypothetical protein
MTTYIVFFDIDAGWGTYEIEANTPKRALALARNFYQSDLSKPYFETRDGGKPPH